jgi:hypothetical protein
VILTKNIKAKEYYLEEILKICYSTSKLKEFKEKLNSIKNLILKEEIKKENVNGNTSIILSDKNECNEENNIEEKENTLSQRRNRRKKKTRPAYYLNNIYNFDDNNKLDSELIDFKTDIDELIKQKIEERKLSLSLKNILKNLKEKLFEPIEQIEYNMLGDFTIIFKSGIILENILRQTSIILKNLTNLSPAVLERFNDLLNYNPKITINEDYCGTFTGFDKELTDFSDSFRVIGICSLESFNNLSDAAKNRFTILYTSEYSDIEKNIISKINIIINNLKKDKEIEDVWIFKDDSFINILYKVTTGLNKDNNESETERDYPNKRLNQIDENEKQKKKI